MRFILDTNAVTAWVKKDAEFLVRLQATPPADIGISVVTEHELRFGIACNPGMRMRAAVERMIDLLPRVGFDSDVAARAANLRADLRRQGQPIGMYDLFIAATALAKNLVLVTHNTREFSRVPGLRVEDWQAS